MLVIVLLMLLSCGCGDSAQRDVVGHTGGSSVGALCSERYAYGAPLELPDGRVTALGFTADESGGRVLLDLTVGERSLAWGELELDAGANELRVNVPVSGERHVLRLRVDGEAVPCSRVVEPNAETIYWTSDGAPHRTVSGSALKLWVAVER